VSPFRTVLVVPNRRPITFNAGSLAYPAWTLNGVLWARACAMCFSETKEAADLSTRIASRGPKKAEEGMDDHGVGRVVISGTSPSRDPRSPSSQAWRREGCDRGRRMRIH
jgi:hypothetical protein